MTMIGRIWMHWPSRGASLGLQCPYVFGKITRDFYAVWDRDTGLVAALCDGTSRETGYVPSPSQVDIFARDHARRVAERLNQIDTSPEAMAQVIADIDATP